MALLCIGKVGMNDVGMYLWMQTLLQKANSNTLKYIETKKMDLVDISSLLLIYLNKQT